MRKMHDQTTLKLSSVTFSMLRTSHNTGLGNVIFPYYGASDTLITVFSFPESAVWNTVQSAVFIVVLVLPDKC